MIANERIRQISLETSQPILCNISAMGHTGLVTLKMERGIVRRVWCGTREGLLVWQDGRTLVHVIPNVEEALHHG